LFGDTIRRRRERLGLTLEQLAERSGLSPNYIGSVENRRRDPSLSTVLALAKGLRAPPGELLGSVPNLSASALEAARLFEQASPEDQESLLRILRSLTRRRR
jgi:transcriptional regulator with XRE-family HTH domain